MRKQRLKFHGQIKRMAPTRLTKQILVPYKIRIKVKTEPIKCIASSEENLIRASITQADVTDRKILRQKIFDWKVDQKEIRKETATLWSDERKRLHSERMEQIWAQSKANQQK